MSLPPNSYPLERRVLLLGAGAAAAWQIANRGPRATSDTRPQARRRPSRPNILWIVTDDQPRRSLRWMPHTMHLIAGHGTIFTNGYASVPLCGPARASMMTSLYVHNHRCRTNTTLPKFVKLGLDQDTVATRLMAAGYVNGYFGKYMNTNRDASYVAPGWDRWVVRLSKSDAYSIDGVHAEVSSNPVQTEAFASKECIDFVRTRADLAWFAVFAPTAPHNPYTPSRRHRDDFDDVAWDPPAFNEANMRDKAEFLRRLPTQDRRRMRRIWERKLEELQDLDDQIRQVIEALRATDQLDRTVIMLVSDNGYLLGEHRLFRKSQPYEESAGIPFLVRGPGFTQGRSSALVSQVDLMPTTLELAGLDPDADRPLEGRSMVAGLRSGEWSQWRARLLSDNPYRQWALLRQGHFALIHYYAHQATELYNLELDPYQLRAQSGGPLSTLMLEKVTEMRSASGLGLRSLET